MSLVHSAWPKRVVKIRDAAKPDTAGVGVPGGHGAVLKQGLIPRWYPTNGWVFWWGRSPSRNGGYIYIYMYMYVCIYIYKPHWMDDMRVPLFLENRNITFGLFLGLSYCVDHPRNCQLVSYPCFFFVFFVQWEKLGYISNLYFGLSPT